MLGLHPFPTFYIADLDAIQRRGDNRRVVADLRDRFPKLEIWVDAGFGTPADWAPWRPCGIRPVVGSESQADTRSAVELLAALRSAAPVLSLDFLGGRFLGPAELLRTPALWPERVIVMTLDRVGMGAGPDLERLEELRRRAPDRRMFVGGGVRDAEDLARLQDLGLHGALVSTALHQGRIGRQVLDELIRQP